MQDLEHHSTTKKYCLNWNKIEKKKKNHGFGMIFHFFVVFKKLGKLNLSCYESTQEQHLEISAICALDLRPCLVFY